MPKTSRRIHRSPEQWQTLLERHQESGLSQREFCRRESISLSTFSHNYRKVQNRTPAFIELQAPAEAQLAEVDAPLVAQENHWSVEVVLPNGSILRFHG